jgi:hypothetical protein
MLEEGRQLSKKNIDAMYSNLYNALNKTNIFDDSINAHLPLNICLHEAKEGELQGSVFYYCGYTEIEVDEQQELLLLETSVDEAVKVITKYVEDEIKNKKPKMLLMI